MVFWKRGEWSYLADTESARYEMVIDSPAPADDVSVIWIEKRNLLGKMGQKKTCKVLLTPP